MSGRRALLVATFALAGCGMRQRRASGPGPAGVRYVVGQPYKSGGTWRYPREQFDYDENGLATVTARTHGVTEDGESADAQAMAAAHPTLQLPCVAKVTNLDNGLQTLVRVNDRGPAQRGRLIALTPRAMQLLGAAGQPAFRVRVQVQEAESRRLAADLNGAEQPTLMLKVETAPTGAVQSEQLPPPPGATASLKGRFAAARPKPFVVAPVASVAVPLRLSEQVFRAPPRPGSLYVEAGSFSQLQYAEILRARLVFLGAQTSTSYDAPRDRAYRVRIGPLANVAIADALLERTARAGVADARIVAE